MDKKLISELKEAVEEVYKDKPILKELCFYQGILESNLLRRPSKLAVVYKNLFGIKGKGTAGSEALITWEEIAGKVKTIVSKFAVFHSLKESVEWHRKLMQKPRYLPVWNSEEFLEASRKIYECGYATDSKYPNKLNKLRDQVKYDSI